MDAPKTFFNFFSINNLKNQNKNNLISFGLMILFLISERPSLFQRLSGIEAPDLNSLLKKIVICILIVMIWLAGLATMYFLARSKPITKWISFILIMISAITFDVFLSVSQNTILYGDYLGLRLAAANIGDAFAEYKQHLLYPLFRSSLLFVAYFIVPSASVNKAEVKAFGLLLINLVIFTGICIKKETAVGKMPGFLSIYGFEFAHLFDHQQYQYNYDHILFDPKTQARRDNIVLIIDESVRYDFINGEETNGELNVKSNQAWNVYDYGSATSGNNCSGYSNIILRKGPKPDHIGSEIQQNPLIWAYAKKAGYRTTLIDAQRSGKGHDYFDQEELNMIDNNVETSGYKTDQDIATELRKLLTNKGNFVIVIKKGAHFPYVANYPATFAPTFKSPYINDKPNRIEYAKAIMYQTGRFFEELLKEPLTPSTLMIYTSDHGQNLNDTTGLTHCTMTSDPYFAEGLVPMLVIDNQLQDNLISYSQTNHNKTSHFNIFSTLLYYLGYEKSDYLKQYGPSLVDPMKRYGIFNYGSPFGYFGSEPKFKTVQETMDYSGAKK